MYNTPYWIWRLGCPLVAICLIVMHMVGYLQPKFFVESRVITWIIESLLFIATLLGMRMVRAAGGASSGGRAIGIGTWCLGTLAVFEASIVSALLVGRGGAVRHLYELLAIDSSTRLEAERSRFGLLMVFSLMAMLTWPAIVMGMRGKLASLASSGGFVREPRR